MSHVTLSVSQRMMLRVVQRMHRLVALTTPRPFASAARNFTSKSHGNLDERLRSLLSSGEAVEGSELQQKLHSNTGISFKDFIKAHTGKRMNYKKWLRSREDVKITEHKKGRFTVMLAVDSGATEADESVGVTEDDTARLRPVTLNQQLYLDQLKSPLPYVVVTGPAGTGKTVLACQEAVDALLDERFKRLVITRPAVATGEDLGYLPGNAEGKLKPYLQPVLDSLEQRLSKSKVNEMLQKGRIEVAVLSFMRGRTFEDCFVIADEMQNASWDQMKMVLTRLGKGSKMVITGDPAQSDLRGHRHSKSGLEELVTRVGTQEMQHLRVIKLEDVDVVRHEAVAEILQLFD